MTCERAEAPPSRCAGAGASAGRGSAGDEAARCGGGGGVVAGGEGVGGLMATGPRGARRASREARRRCTCAGRGWSVSQRRQPGLEWEHIVPFEKARTLFKRSRSYIRKYTHQIGAIGTFVAIDSRSNRVFNDCSIARKVGWDAASKDKTYADYDFVRTHIKLTPAEIELLKVVDHELEAGRNKEVAGEAFLKFVTMRGRRIWRRVCAVVGPPPRPHATDERVRRS